MKAIIDRLVFKKRGRPTYLTPDEEAVAVCSAELHGQIGMPNTRRVLGGKLNQMVTCLPINEKRKIKDASHRRYARRVVQRVIKNEIDKDGQSLYSLSTAKSSGEIKVSGLSNARARQSDPRLSWIMYHRILKMYEVAYDAITGVTAGVLETLPDSPDSVQDASKVDILPDSTTPDLVETHINLTSSVSDDSGKSPWLPPSCGVS